jgi:hypothetical protein
MTTRALLLTVGFITAGCGARPNRVERYDDLPAALADLEATSEKAYDRAVAGDAAAVAQASTRLLDDWTRLRGDARRRGAADDVLSEMDAAVVALGDAAGASTDPIVLGRAVNRITGSLDEIFALYDPTVSAGVMEIDYLGREIALDGMAADMHHAGTHSSMLDEAWMELRPALEASPASKLDEAVKAIRAAVTSRDPDAIAACARDLVARVYDVESGLATR